jgi:hypothetical protein
MRDHQPRGNLHLAVSPFEPLLAQIGILSEQLGEAQFGSVGGQAANWDLYDLALGEVGADLAKVALEAAHHHGVARLGSHLHAATKTLRVEDFEQRGKTVGMAVVGCRREEKTMFKPIGDVAHHPRKTRVDAVAGAAGGRRVMGLVEDEHRAGAEIA